MAGYIMHIIQTAGGANVEAYVSKEKADERIIRLAIDDAGNAPHTIERIRLIDGALIGGS